MTEEESTPLVKKKRGRRPKNVTNTPVAEQIGTVEIAEERTTIREKMPEIIQIRKTQLEEIDDESNFEKTFCDYNPNVEIPNAYDKDDSFCAVPSSVEGGGATFQQQSVDFMMKEDSADAWPRQTETYCFWCSHNFTNVPIGIPVKVFDEKFYCTGNFCSFECASAYNYNMSNDTCNLFEKQNLLNLMASKFKQKTPIRCAKPREMLKIFGGGMDINEFRKRQEDLIFFSNKYPIVPVGEQVEEIHDSFSTQAAETFTIQKTVPTPKQKTMTEFV